MPSGTYVVKRNDKACLDRYLVEFIHVEAICTHIKNRYMSTITRSNSHKVEEGIRNAHLLKSFWGFSVPPGPVYLCFVSAQRRPTVTSLALVGSETRS